MQKLLLIFALFAITAFASIPVNMEELKSLWTTWKMYHGKAYSPGEETARFAIFVDNYQKIISHNAASDNVKLGLNGFSDLTATEFKTIYASGYIPSKTRPADDTTDYSNHNLADGVDWRQKGAVTAVKNQGQCGSCWTFATTGALEGFHFIRQGVLLSFSEQQIVDCDTNEGGCNGGNTDEALNFIASTGIELELTYPYTAQNGNCKYVRSLAVQTNSGMHQVGVRNADGVKAALNQQPVAVAIEADQSIFQSYSSGVIGEGCGTGIDHAVLAVGYTTVSGQEAFIIKNSWGAGWGQNGYVYLSTDGSINGGEGACGVLSDPCVPN